MSNAPMTKAQLVAHFAEKFSLTKVQAAEIISEFSRVAADEALAKGEFTIPGIGKLVRSHRPARIGRNPSTGESMSLPESYAAKIRLAKTLKDALK